MGNILNYILWGGDPDEQNPTTGLSKRDVYNIQRSWNRLYSDAIGNGMHLFVKYFYQNRNDKLFRTAPAAKTFFVQIRDKTEEEYTRSNQFKAHVLNFMTSLNMAVQNINQPEVVIPLMHKLGTAHKRFNVKPEHFDIVTTVLVDVLKNDLKENDAVVASWGKFVAFIYPPIFEKL